MSTPDVRVRLSPEGINEVIAALRLLQKEGKAAGAAAASSVGTVNTALRDLKSLLPALGLAAVVGGFIALTKQAIATADATGKLQQKVGGTVEEISGLTLAFRTNQSDQEGLQKGLLKTANFMQDVANGNEKARGTLRDLGIEQEKFVKLSTPRALEEIARGLAKIPPGAARAAAASDVFGEKIGGGLLTALNAVGTQGIDPFIKKAKELGVLIDEDLANAAARASDALGIIKIQAEGLATQFAAGLAPAIADAMEEITRATTGGTNGFRTFGEAIGFVVRLATFLFVGLGKTIAATVAKVVSFVDAIIDAGKAIAQGDFAGAGEAFKRSARERASIEVQLAEDIQETRDRLFRPPGFETSAKAGEKSAAGVSPLPGVDEEARKTQQARQAFIKNALANELKLQQEAIRSQEAALKRGYDRGVLSLAQFFEKRKELIERQRDAEISALKIERASIAQGATGDNAPKTEADRIKLRTQLANLNAQIKVAEVQAQRELAGLEGERAAATKQLANDQLQLAGKLAELEGKRHEAFLANLQSEIDQIRELGKRAGQTADEIDVQVRRLIDSRTAAFDFEEATRKGEAALSAFTRDAEQIRRDQEAGIISQLEGEMRLIELERSRLELLKELAAQLLIAAQATGSEEQIAKAQAYADSIDQIAASYRGATDASSQLRTGGIEALQSGFENFLANADKIKDIGDAFRSLALSVVQSLQKIAAEILAKQAIFALLRAIGGASGGGGFGGAVGQAASVGFGQHGGRIRGYAGGGDVRGPRLAIAGPDKIPILAEEGEFMVKRKKVMEPGALNFLRRWNTGAFTMAQAMRVPRFATGGQIGAPQGTPPAASSAATGLRIINLVDENLVSDGISSASGERAVLNVISRNSTSVKRMLGGR